MQLARHAAAASQGHVLPSHPECSEHAYFLAVETAFTRWEAMQNVGR
jgi:hypothetical protein